MQGAHTECPFAVVLPLWAVLEFPWMLQADPPSWVNVRVFMTGILSSDRRALLSVGKASLTDGEAPWLILSCGNLVFFIGKFPYVTEWWS